MIQGPERSGMTEPDFEADYRLDWRDPRIAPHAHDFYECFCLLSGDIDYFSGERCHRVKGGDVLIIPPNTSHNPVPHRSRSTYERVVLWVRPQLIDRLAALDPDLSGLTALFEGGCLFPGGPGAAHATGTEPQGLPAMFLEMARLYALKDPCYRSEGIATMLRLMAAMAGMAHLKPASGSEGWSVSPEDKSENETMSALLAYVHENLDRKLSLGDLEKRLLTGRQTLARMMRRQMGTSFYQYVLHKRLMLARDLLIDGVPATQLHARCGFSDHSCLYRAFMREFGTSPREYLRRHESAADSPLASGD